MPNASRPRFLDYHRTIIGYHGTRRSVALAIVQGEQDFLASKNNDDWLGHGVYFWEHAPQQAWWWAERLRQKNNWDEEVAVLGSMIRLGFCFDLLDPYNIQYLEEIYSSYKSAMEIGGIEPPQNFNHRKYLDCALFQYAYALLQENGEVVDTCRAVYVPTKSHLRIWKRSWITKQAHLQVCVRNKSSILGTWLLKPEGESKNDRRSPSNNQDQASGPETQEDVA